MTLLIKSAYRSDHHLWCVFRYAKYHGDIALMRDIIDQATLLISRSIIDEIGDQRLIKLCPIPLRDHHIAVRGFSPQHLFAEGLAKVMRSDMRYQIDLQPKRDRPFYQVMVDHHMIKRDRLTKSQTGLTRDERLSAQRDSLRVLSKTCTDESMIILIDDVVTTGSTLREAERALLKSSRAAWGACTLFSSL